MEIRTTSCCAVQGKTRRTHGSYAVGDSRHCPSRSGSVRHPRTGARIKKGMARRGWDRPVTRVSRRCPNGHHIRPPCPYRRVALPFRPVPATDGYRTVTRGPRAVSRRCADRGAPSALSRRTAVTAPGSSLAGDACVGGERGWAAVPGGVTCHGVPIAAVHGRGRGRAPSGGRTGNDGRSPPLLSPSGGRIVMDRTVGPAGRGARNGAPHRAALTMAAMGREGRRKRRRIRWWEGGSVLTGRSAGLPARGAGAAPRRWRTPALRGDVHHR